MAYRRKQGMQRSATFVEDHRQASSGGPSSPAIASPRATRFADDNRRPDRASRLAGAQATAASYSAALGDLTLPAFGDRFAAAGTVASHGDSQPGSPMQDPVTQLYTSTTKLNDDGPKYDLELSQKDDARHGFWSLVAQKAKVMLDENGTPRTHVNPSESRWSYDRVQSSEGSPTSRKGPPSEGRIDIGGKIKNVLEQEGLAVANVNTTPAPAGGVVAVKKLQIRRKACSMDFRSANLVTPESPLLPDVESPQIKASRDVANAMSAKVKLLQREMKTLKADLAFSKERCAQLEEENRQLRDGANPDADEDMIRQQLETLLAEKARVANENTLYARENRFLREIVEYHQLNMQDVVNLDDDDDDDDIEDIEEEDEDDVADADDDTEQEPEQYQDRGASSPSQLVQEEEEEQPHQEAGPDTAPQSPSSRRPESPQVLTTDSRGGTMDHESPLQLNTNSAGTSVEHEQPRLLSTNSGIISHDESPDDGSSPETTMDD